MSHRKAAQFYYFQTKPPPFIEKWKYLRMKAKKSLSPTAQLKLEWIAFYFTAGQKNARTTALHFSISRKTLHKWLRRFTESNLLSLEEQARVPVGKRQWMVTPVEQERICALRRKFMEFGKKKLQAVYQTTYGETISTWKIERVIRRYSLYPLPIKKKYATEKSRIIAKKVRIHHLREQLKKHNPFGFLWHIDTVIIWWYGTKRYIFTAIEESTRIAYARVYLHNTSGFAEDFLQRLMYLVEAKIEIIHSDNGSEFKGAFESACQKLNIKQIYSRAYTPKDNSKLEKFNATIQKEWLDFSVVGLDTIPEANSDLIEWLIKYNTVRPHASLNYQTPMEFAQKQYFKVEPMWSARSYT